MRPVFRARLGLLALLAALLFAAAPAWSQSTATLQGTVTDAQGGVMPGVSVTIHNTATAAERAVVTDTAGDYVAAAAAARPLRSRRRMSTGLPIRSAKSISARRRRSPSI